jgi:hypothetical protein
MKKLNFKSGLIRTLPNILGLSSLRKKLYQAEFKQDKNRFIRTCTVNPADNKIKKLSQFITIKEDLKLTKINQQIKKFNLKGFILPTNLLEQALQNAPLPLSAQKQILIQSFAQMNNGRLNEAEGIHIVHSNNTPIEKIKKYNPLAPNLCSQLISELHFNKSSRLTLGESHLEDEADKLPYGQAILQISHLTYHALDLDLSSEVDRKFESKRLSAETVVLHEHCFSIPYSIKDKRYSPHGFILHLNGENITPAIINQIIGFKDNGFAGLAIVSGDVSGHILDYKKHKTLFNAKETTFTKKETSKVINECIGNYIFDPTIKTISTGTLTVENIGKLEQLNGEITLVFFPLLQSFIAEYQ